MNSSTKVPGKHGGFRGGSRKGIPNKATTDVREAIAVFAQANVGNMHKWLTQVAEGRDPVYSEEGNLLVKGADPDPGRALDLYLKAIEYNIPRLGRTIISGDPNAPIPVYQWVPSGE